MVMVSQLEASPPAGMVDSVWKPPYVSDLKKEWDGFIELRKKVNNVNYRLIAKRQNRSVFLVTWGYHGGKGWYVDIPPKTALIRVNQMITDPTKYRREHEL